MLGCYLLHFDRPIYRAQHYLGWSVNIARRVRLHQRGKGARLVAQALAAGIGVDLVRVWLDVDQAAERALKRRGPKSFCPECQPKPRRKKRTGAPEPVARRSRAGSIEHTV